MSKILWRLWTILRSHWGYWRCGRRERREQVEANQRTESNRAQVESNRAFLAHFATPRPRPMSLSEVEAARRRTDPSLARDRFNPGRNTA